MGVRQLVVANGPNIFQMLLVLMYNKIQAGKKVKGLVCMSI